MHYQLAQVNIARTVDSIESETMKGLVDQIETIHALADQYPGFVWRLKAEEVKLPFQSDKLISEIDVIQIYNDPNLLVNISVWENLERYKHFVYKSFHADLLRQRRSWFEKLESTTQALWWIPKGYIPTINEANMKLQQIQKNGVSKDCFSFHQPFPPPTIIDNK